MRGQEDNSGTEDLEMTTSFKVDDTEETHPLKSNSRPNDPFIDASFFSKLCFTWPESLLKKGMMKTLEDKDLPNLAMEDQSGHNRKIFERIWQNEVDRVESLKRQLPKGSKRRAHLRPSLQRALIVDFFKSNWIIQPCMVARETAKITMSIALGKLIDSFASVDSNDGYIWATVFTVCSAIVLFEFHFVFFLNYRKGMQLRIGAISSIVAKSLRLDALATGDTTSLGQTMNLISNDVERFLLVTAFGPYIIWAPLQAIVVIAVGSISIGPAFCVGAALLIFVIIPLQIMLGRRYAFMRSKVATITDERINLISQTMDGIRVLKTSGWDTELQSRILGARCKELKHIKRSNLSKALNDFLSFTTHATLTVLICVVHIFVFNAKLAARDVFTTISLGSLLIGGLTVFFPRAVMTLSEFWICTSRIQRYLEVSELGSEKGTISPPIDNVVKNEQVPGDEVIRVNNITCYWGYKSKASQNDLEICDEDMAALRNVSLSLKRNEITFVVGAVGSGKSALLSALVGELLPHQGTVKRSYSSLAYAPQNPWLMNGTIRENIVMGQLMDPILYRKVVDACGLLTDFRKFVNNDQTILGEKGVQCSGGQRARIGLARALYRDADVLILDDPLSAVDSRVGRQIYDTLEDLALKQGKCIVLATHQLQYLGNGPSVHMSNGKLTYCSDMEHCVDDTVVVDCQGGDTIHEYAEDATVDNFVADEEESESDEHDPNKDQDGEGLADRHGDKESKVTGAVSSSTLRRYIKSMGTARATVCLSLSFLIVEGVLLLTYSYLGHLADMEDQRSGKVLAAIFGLVFTLMLFTFYRSTSFYSLATGASGKIHDDMIRSVFRSKMQFFDVNPSGRILNRFSGDVGSNDELLPSTLHSFIDAAIYVLGTIIVISVALPFVLCTIPPMVWYLFRVRRMYTISSRELKRFEGLSRSLIFATVSDITSGISTIRCNNATEFITTTFESHHDSHTRAFWAFLGCNRWLGFRSSFLMFVFTGSGCFFGIFLSQTDWFEVDPVLYGLGLSLLIELGMIFQVTVRLSGDVMDQMISVERALEYTELLPEASLRVESDEAIANSWPENGSIEVQNLSIRYRETLPLSLDSVSFTIPFGHRVGIVGRTGSGKSTFVQALFRLIEAESGTISIAGIDISNLGLHKLRTGMSVISQHPVLFGGCTVRENLDPFQSSSDEQIMSALEDVQMMKVVNSLPFGVNSRIAGNGDNFSTGQRQLLCLARAILQKSKILVLDEPSSNIDSQTDKLIQEAVRKSFKGATIISIAHRLDTIIDNDHVLVLGSGKVLEFGSPSELLSLNGHFASLVNETGHDMAESLKKKATVS